MKILHIVPTYWPAYGRGGPIWSVHNMNKRLVRKGVDVTVYTTDIDILEKVPLNQEIKLDGVKVYYFKASFPRIWEYWRVGFLPAFLPRHWEYSRDLHKALQKTVGQFDLIHITSTFLFASILGFWYAQKNKKPYIISPRGNLMEPLELKNPFLKRIYIAIIERWVLKNAAIHFTVPKEKEDYKRYRLPLYRTSFVIPNGIEKEEFVAHPRNGYFRKQLGISKNRKIVLFLGRLNWKKGLDVLISAMALVIKENPKALLVIAGSDEGGYRQKVEKWIEDYNIRSHVIFTGMLRDENKLGALVDSDVFVLSSYSENFSMAAVEAMYFCMPVVITNNVGIAPYVKEAKAGFVVFKEKNELAGAILKILEDPTSKKSMGENGKKLVEREFAMSKIADRWIEAYQELIAQ